MRILYKTIHNINIPQGLVAEKTDIPEDFGEFIQELVRHTTNNEGVRLYKVHDVNTQVVRCVQDAVEAYGSDLIAEEKKQRLQCGAESIADKLLRTEVDMQIQVAPMNVQIKQGSLFQSLLRDENGHYLYIIAKVEHQSWIDSDSLRRSIGFPGDKLNVWKSAVFLMNLEQNGITFEHIKVYTDNAAKYWSQKFLELDEVSTDERNTSEAFKAIETELKRSVKKVSEFDYIHLRNAVITYMKTNRQIDYPQMVTDIFAEYIPECGNLNMRSIVINMRGLPGKRNFDQQFTSIPSEVKAKRSVKYRPISGIEVHIADDIADMESNICSFCDHDQRRFLRIACPDEETFRAFYRENIN